MAQIPDCLHRLWEQFSALQREREHFHECTEQIDSRPPIKHAETTSDFLNHGYQHACRNLRMLNGGLNAYLEALEHNPSIGYQKQICKEITRCRRLINVKVRRIAALDKQKQGLAKDDLRLEEPVPQDLLNQAYFDVIPSAIEIPSEVESPQLQRFAEDADALMFYNALASDGAHCVLFGGPFAPETVMAAHLVPPELEGPAFAALFGSTHIGLSGPRNRVPLHEFAHKALEEGLIVFVPVEPSKRETDWRCLLVDNTRGDEPIDDHVCWKVRQLYLDTCFNAKNKSGHARTALDIPEPASAGLSVLLLSMASCVSPVLWRTQRGLGNGAQGTHNSLGHSGEVCGLAIRPALYF